MSGPGQVGAAPAEERRRAGLSWAALAPQERLIVVGGALAIVGSLLNIAFQQVINAGSAPIVIVAAGFAVGSIFTAGRAYAANWPLPAPAVARAGANIVALFAILDLLELLPDLSAADLPDDMLSLVAPIVVLAGAAALVVGALRLNAGLARPDVTSLSRPQYLVIAGGGLAILGWALMVTVGDIFEIGFLPAVGIAAIALALISVTMSRDPSVADRDIPWDFIVAALAAVAIVVALVHLGEFMRVIEQFDIGGIEVLGPYVIWIVGLILVALGAMLWARDERMGPGARRGP